MQTIVVYQLMEIQAERLAVGRLAQRMGFWARLELAIPPGLGAQPRSFGWWAAELP